ncbi:MAG TPA: O-antigen ligase family protein [Chloroflexaceae bacterium]|nr:O-antigen ligase family protein [Chloroflexaceae bacterium]
MLLFLGITALLLAVLLVPLAQSALDGDLRILDLLFAASVLPFLAVIILFPRWRAAAAIALIFILPGPIDSLLPRVSIGYTPDASLRIVSLLDLVFLLVVVLRWPVIRRQKLLSPTLLVLLAAMTILSVLSSLSSLDRLLGYREGALLTGILPLRLFLVYLFVSSSIHTARQVSDLLLGVVVGALGLLANGAYFSLVNASPRFTAGVFGNNTFGNVLAIIGLIAVGMFLLPAPRHWRYLGLVTGGLCAVGIVLTGTRMSVVAFGLGAIALITAMPIALPRRLTLIGLIVGASSAVLLVGGRLFSTSISRLLDLPRLILSGELLGVSEMQTRLTNWAVSFQMLEEHPWLGIGPGQWNFERIEHGLWLWIDVFDPHNGYILLATEYGLPFLLLFALLVGYCFWQGLAALRAAYARRDRVVAATLLPVLIAAAAIALTELTNAGLLKLHLQLFYGVVFFTLVASRRFAQSSEQPQQRAAGVSPSAQALPQSISASS